jgi:hypothetical protein
MKRLLLTVIFASTAAITLQSCYGTYAVSGPPAYPTETVVVAPSVYHVWVPGTYVYRNNTYVWRSGYYAVPPKGKTQYHQGRWNQTTRGYRYEKGKWH